MRENGSTTILVLAVVVILTIASSWAFLFLQYNTKYIAESMRDDEEKRLLIQEAERLVDLLKQDETPHANSVSEKLMLENSEDVTIRVKIEDVSSRLNLNWIIGEELKESGFLIQGVSYFDFQAFRYENGFLTDFSCYTDFVQEEDLARYFSPYNYFNVNICAELVLEELYVNRTDDREGAEIFRNDIREVREQNKPGLSNNIEPDMIHSFLGDDNYMLLYPVVNAQPVMNVHFIPTAILVNLFRYFKVPDPESKADNLIHLREISELSIENLTQMLGKRQYTQSRLHHFIGTITWFWEIEIIKTLENDNFIGLRWIIARIPNTENSEQIIYRLVKEEYFK